MRHLVLPLIYLFTYLCPPVWADDDLTKLSIDELLEVTVSVASKTEENLVDAPSAVTVFTRQDILQMGVTSMDQLLNFVPSFQVTQDNDQGRLVRVTARGRSTAFSESVLFLLNGQRLNDHLFGGSPLNNRMIPVENIKQVEIIRGPGSALYGSNAFMGVVNIQTVDDVSDFSVQGGDQGQRLAWINFNTQTENDLKISVFAKVYGQEGSTYRGHPDLYGNTESTKDPFTNIYFFNALQWHHWTLNFAHSKHRQEDFYAYGVIGNGHNREKTRQTWLNLKFHHEFSDRFHADFSASGLQSSYVNYSLIAPANLPLSGFEQEFLGSPLAEQSAINFNVDGRYYLSDANELIAGFSYEQAKNTDIASIFTHDPVTFEYQGGKFHEFRGDKTYNGLHKRDIYGIYIQDKHHFNEALSLTTGARFDAYSDFGQSLNPRFALVYKTDLDAHVKFMYGRAFRAPNFTELYDKNNPFDFGDPDLNAETVDTLEWAYLQNWQQGQAAITLFDYKIDNVINVAEEVSTHPDNPFQAPRFANLGDSKGRGIELEFKVEPFTNWRVSANWSHFLDEDQILGYSNTGSLVTNYQKGRFNVNYNVFYRNKIKFLPEQSSYSISNLAVQMEMFKNFQLKATIYNLFDKRYYTPAPVTLPGGVPNPGRTFLIGIQGQL